MGIVNDHDCIVVDVLSDRVNPFQTITGLLQNAIRNSLDFHDFPLFKHDSRTFTFGLVLLVNLVQARFKLVFLIFCEVYEFHADGSRRSVVGGVRLAFFLINAFDIVLDLLVIFIFEIFDFISKSGAERFRRVTVLFVMNYHAVAAWIVSLVKLIAEHTEHIALVVLVDAALFEHNLLVALHYWQLHFFHFSELA